MSPPPPHLPSTVSVSDVLQCLAECFFLYATLNCQCAAKFVVSKLLWGGGGGCKERVERGFREQCKVLCRDCVSILCMYMHTYNIHAHMHIHTWGGGGGYAKRALNLALGNSVKFCVVIVCQHSVHIYLCIQHTGTHARMYVGRAEWGFKGGGWKRLLLWLRDDYINFVVSVTYNYVNFTVSGRVAAPHHLVRCCSWLHFTSIATRCRPSQTWCATHLEWRYVQSGWFVVASTSESSAIHFFFFD